MTRPWFASAIVVGIVSAAASAHAQESLSLAEQRYRRGVELFMAQRYAQALGEFQMSIQLYDSPNARLFVARCLDRLNRPVQALAEFERTAREADERARTDARYAATRDAARDELRHAEQRVGRLTVTVRDAPNELQVTVEGNAVPVAALGLPLPVAPGPVNVVATAPGFARVERQVFVEAAHREQVNLTMRLLEPSATSSAPPSAAPAVIAQRHTDPPRSSSLAAAGWATLTFGGLGLVGFGVTYALAFDQYQRLVRDCPEPAGCATSPDGDVARGRALEIAAFTSLGVGLAATALGIGFLAVAGRRHDRPVVVVAPGYIGVTGVF